MSLSKTVSVERRPGRAEALPVLSPIYRQRFSQREEILSPFPKLTTIFHRTEEEIWALKRTHGRVYEMAKRGTPKPSVPREEDPEGHRLHEQSVAAAMEWARLLLKPEVVDELKAIVRSCKKPPIIVPILSANSASGDATGSKPTLNSLPLGYAVVLAEVLGLELRTPIIQKTKVGRAGASAWERILKQAEFKLTGSSSEVKDENIILVDDHVTQGSTLMNALCFLRRCKAKVIAASVLGASTAPYELYVPPELYQRYIVAPHPARPAEFAKLYSMLSGRDFNPSEIRLTDSEFIYMARQNLMTFAIGLSRAIQEKEASGAADTSAAIAGNPPVISDSAVTEGTMPGVRHCGMVTREVESAFPKFSRGDLMGTKVVKEICTGRVSASFVALVTKSTARDHATFGTQNFTDPTSATGSDLRDLHRSGNITGVGFAGRIAVKKEAAL